MSSGREKNILAFHKEALGGIVIANGFFTGAVFLSVTSTITPLAGIPRNCMAGNDIIRNLFLFQVGSLVFYSLSSLIATAAKLLVVFFEETNSLSPKTPVTIAKIKPEHQQRQQDQGGEDEEVCSWEPMEYQYPSRNPPARMLVRNVHWSPEEMLAVARKLSPWVRRVMISSIVCSAVGSFFLVLSIINMVQIKIGLVSCGNTIVVITAVGAALLLFFGLGVYLFMSWYFIKHVF